jgi:ankyrin repeat protein
MFQAINSRNAEVVEFLLEGRGQMNPNPDTYGPPPLGRAIQIGDERLVSILLEYGADPTASHGEDTMVELARRQTNNAIFSLIQHAVKDLPTATDGLIPRWGYRMQAGPRRIITR